MARREDLGGSRVPLSEKQLAGRLGGLKSWANTVDRTARTSNGRAKAPGSVEYWIERLDPRFDNATEAQRHAAAEAARRAYFTELSMKSARAREERNREAGKRASGSSPSTAKKKQVEE